MERRNRHRIGRLVALALLSAGSGCQVRLGGGGLVLDHDARREDVLALALGADELLTLESQQGGIRVTARDDAPPELHAVLRASARTSEEAEAVLARHQVRLERGPEGIVATLVGAPAAADEGESRVTLDLEARVPSGTRLAARSDGGDLTTRGRLGALRLDTRHGTIRIDEAHGPVHASSASGDVEARLLAGGEAELRSRYGAVRVEEARLARLTCASGSGDLRVGAARVDALELESRYGGIEVETAGGSVRASSGSGDVRLRGVRGTVEAHSGYGAVEVEGVLTGLVLSSGSGALRARALPGSRVESAWTLESRYGRVTLDVPDDFACVLDAHTRYGEVACELPVTLEAGQRRGEKRLAGSIGAGGGRVVLASDNGDVELLRL